MLTVRYIIRYKESSFMGNYEGIQAIRVEDWLMEKRGYPSEA